MDREAEWMRIPERKTQSVESVVIPSKYGITHQEERSKCRVGERREKERARARWESPRRREITLDDSICQHGERAHLAGRL